MIKDTFVPKFKPLKPGWILFGEYCRLNGIKRQGNERKLLGSMDERYRVNLTPLAKIPTYAVMASKADKVFYKLFDTNKNDKW